MIHPLPEAERDIIVEATTTGAGRHIGTAEIGVRANFFQQLQLARSEFRRGAISLLTK